MLHNEGLQIKTISFHAHFKTKALMLIVRDIENQVGVKGV